MADFDTERDNKGRWLPGAPSPNPNGRPKKAKEQSYLDELKGVIPPEKLGELLQQALDAAVASNSWRGILAVAELCLNYAVGKPTLRVQTVDSNLSELLAAIDMSKPLLPPEPDDVGLN